MAGDSTSRSDSVNFRSKMAASSLVDVVERIVNTASYVIMLNIVTRFMTGAIVVCLAVDCNQWNNRNCDILRLVNIIIYSGRNHYWYVIVDFTKFITVIRLYFSFSACAWKYNSGWCAQESRTTDLCDFCCAISFET